MRRTGLACVFVLPLAACSATVEVGSLNPFRGRDAPAGPAAPVDRHEPVAAVLAVEAGQAHRGLIVTATGAAQLQGYFRPELRLRNGGRPGPDGFIELDFVAIPPETTTLQPGDAATRRLVAAQFLPSDLVAAARGVRVIAAGGALERRF